MMRVALTELTVDAVWQALQVVGWTEDQLTALQRELSEIDLLKNLPVTLELERVAHLQELNRYRDGGVVHLQELTRQLGFTPIQSGAWKQRLHHAHWSLFRYRDIELRVIREMQQQIDRTRLFAEGHPFNALSAAPAPWERSALDAWFDNWAEPGRGFPLLSMYYGAFTSTRAIESVARNETARRLALVALALERFRLVTGNLPQTLEQLVPVYLEAVPVDLLQGHPIRYERQPHGRFSLFVQDAAGRPQKVLGEPLAWPAAEPPLPFLNPPPLEDEAQSDDLLPLVQFEKAPLVDAIKVLARQAEINCIFDPRVLESDWPPVSLRLENVSARRTLEAVLLNNGLRLETDRRTRISRITL